MKQGLKKTIIVFLFLFLLTMLLASSSSTVYITANGKKYHRISCRTISNSKTVTSLSIDQAKKRGYTSCKVCKP